MCIRSWLLRKKRIKRERRRGGSVQCSDSGVALGYIQNDSIRSLNVGKNWFNSISDLIVADQNSMQTIIQLKRLVVIKFNRWFNSNIRESLILVKSENFLKNARNLFKIDKNWKLKILIQYMIIYDSFWSFLPEFNSKYYSVFFPPKYSIKKSFNDFFIQK